MRKFQEKNKWKNIVQSKLFLILFGILIILFIWNVLGLFGRMKDTAKNRKIEEDKISELNKREKELSANIYSLKTEKGVEANIREKFGLVKDGEEMIVVVDDITKNSTIKDTSSKSFLSFLKNLFNK